MVLRRGWGYATRKGGAKEMNPRIFFLPKNVEFAFSKARAPRTPAMSPRGNSATASGVLLGEADFKGPPPSQAGREPLAKAWLPAAAGSVREKGLREDSVCSPGSGVATGPSLGSLPDTHP